MTGRGAVAVTPRRLPPRRLPPRRLPPRRLPPRRLAPRRPVALVLAVAAAVVATALLAGCGPQDGDHAAGERLATGSPTVTGELPGAPSPASSAAVAAAGLDPCPTPAGTAPAATDGLPDLELPCLGTGPAVRLSQLRGPLVVNVWASWCGPCKAELPVLADAAERAGTTVRFLGVDVSDFDPDGALGLLARAGVTYPSVVDYANATKPALRWLGPPMTVLVRADGSIAYRHPGELGSVDELAGLLREHLGVDLP